MIAIKIKTDGSFTNFPPRYAASYSGGTSHGYGSTHGTPAWFGGIEDEYSDSTKTDLPRAGYWSDFPHVVNKDKRGYPNVEQAEKILKACKMFGIAGPNSGTATIMSEVFENLVKDAAKEGLELGSLFTYKDKKVKLVYRLAAFQRTVPQTSIENSHPWFIYGIAYGADGEYRGISFGLHEVVAVTEEEAKQIIES